MDWLAEVAGIKFFGSLTLHVAISVVDRFLRRQKVTRSRLQLLGVAAMVLCSRSVSILTTQTTASVYKLLRVGRTARMLLNS